MTSELLPYQKACVNFICRSQTDLYREIETSEGKTAVQMAVAKLGRGVLYVDAGLALGLIAIVALIWFVFSY